MTKGNLLACSLALASLALAVRPAAATPSEAQPPPSAQPPGADDAALRERQAHEHFEKGVKLSTAEDWAGALTEFLASRALHPTRSASTNAALCLGHLHREAEAVEMFEVLLDQFPDLPPEQKLAAEREVERLRTLVGALEVRAAEPGTAIAVDGQPRGELPLRRPVYVMAGRHLVRASRKGFEPFETTVDVAAGQSREVPIQPLVETPATPPTPAAVSPPPEVPLPVAPRATPGWAWIAGGTGLVLLGVGAGFGAGALGAQGAITTACGGDVGACPQAQQANVSPLKTREDLDRNLFIGFAAAGAVGLGVGVFGVATASPARASGHPSLAVAPFASPTGGGVAMQGGF